MLINLQKTSVENLIDLILDANPGAELTGEQFTTPGPEALVEPVGDLNTSIQLRAVLGQGYSSAVTFRYTRLTLDANLAKPLDALTVTGGCDSEDIFGFLTTRLGLMASEVEVVSCTPPTINDDIGLDTTDGNITIKAKDDSILYIGTYSLTLKAKIDPRMDDVFAVTDLDGFEADKEELPEEDGEDPNDPQGPLGNIESVTFTPASGPIVLAEGQTFQYSVQPVGTGAAELELDIIIENPASPLSGKEQFSLYADENNPYGDDAHLFQQYGIDAIFEDGKWDINFGANVTAALAASGEVKIYAVVRDINGQLLWGDMNKVTPEMLTRVDISFEEPSVEPEEGEEGEEG